MPGKKYIYRGKHLFVDALGKSGFRTFFRGTCNDRHPVSLSELPIRNTPEEAQQDLETFASRLMLKAV